MRLGDLVRAGSGLVTILVIAFVVALAVASLEGCSGSSQRAPNVVLLISDDHTFDDLSCCGNASLATPALDAFRAEGMWFTHAFTPTALCVPSRAALMTGSYPARSGVTGFDRETGRVADGVATLVELMQQAGYRTGLVGKGHLYPVWRYAWGTYDFDNRRVREPEALREQVSAFLGADDERPFFLTVAFNDPHRPFPRRTEVDEPQNPREVRVPPYLFDTPKIRAELGLYYDAVKRLDRGVRAVLEEIAPHREETIVFFTADHGASLPFAKATLYDAGIRVPLLVRWPGHVQPGSRSDAFVSFVDYLPTLLEAMGRRDLVPAEIDGRSFLPVLRGEPYEARDRVFASDTHHIGAAYPKRAVRTRRFKYIYNYPVEGVFETEAQSGSTWSSIVEHAKTNPEAQARRRQYEVRPREELYDLERDPAELVNLAGRPRFAARRAALAGSLRAWMAEQGDPWLAEWPE